MLSLKNDMQLVLYVKTI